MSSSKPPVFQLNSAQEVVAYFLGAFREWSLLRDQRIKEVNENWKESPSRAEDALKQLHIARKEMGATDLRVTAYERRFPDLANMWQNATRSLRSEQIRLISEAESSRQAPKRPERSTPSLSHVVLNCHSRYTPVSRFRFVR